MNTFPAVEAFRGGTKLIKVVGHRGARGILPENSMIGFTFAMSAGVPLLEFDVMMTSDLVPVITHNYKLHAAMSYLKKDFYAAPSIQIKNTSVSIGNEYMRQKGTFMSVNDTQIKESELDVKKLYSNSVMSK